jgi:3-methylornithine--L-lysine ligase
MLVAVIGGKLQGVEITYLAKKAGFDVLLIDKNSNVPACGLCDQFLRANIMNNEEVSSHLEKSDIIFPAFENLEGLTHLNQLCLQLNKPFVFDLNAYRISTSKLDSDQLFAKLQLPQPTLWPACRFPVVVKPSEGSGSNGVQIFNSYNEALHYYTNQFPPIGSVVQQYIDGPSYSIEVIGALGSYLPFQITELGMDTAYDCKRVTAPVDLPETLTRQFESLSIKIADQLNLKGIMDVEVILHDNQLKILEIDARFPSQTPITVYWSSGENMVQVLSGLFKNKIVPNKPSDEKKQFVIFEHIKVTPAAIQVEGEHIMGRTGPLHLEKNFFGADEAITDYREEQGEWVATLIMTGKTESELTNKKTIVFNNIKNQFHIEQVLDSDPTSLNS